MLGVLTALSLGLFGGPWKAQRIEGWRLEVRRDDFAHVVLCRLSRPHAFAKASDLVWRLGSKIDTSSALYRIDDGPPVAAPFFALSASANLANPSDGRIALDLSELSAAKRVSAEVRAGGHVYSLRVQGLGQALAAAQTAGCDRFIAPAD